jgi:hypothetical protein
MKDSWFVLLVLSLVILCAGDPDLLDAVVKWVMTHSGC